MQSVSATTYAVAGAGLIAMSYGLARFAFGLYVPSIRGELDLTAGVTGVVGAMAYVSFSLASLLAAPVAGYLGARGAAILASLFGLFGLLTISGAAGAWTLGIGVFACGICTGLMMPALTAGMQSAVPAFVHGRVSAVMNSGTSIGVIVSVPTVVLLTDLWREAYFGFALIAFLCALVAWRLVPHASRARRAQEGIARLARSRRSPLLRLVVFGLGMGVVSSTYWVFAPDMAVAAGGLDSSATGWMWLALGLAGLGGAAAGDLADRCGVARTQGLAFAVMSLSLVVLALAPGSIGLAVFSAALFGLVYMILTGIHLVAGVRLLPERQSLGAAVPFLAIAVGQAAGSPVTGALVDRMGHIEAFVVMSIVGALFVLGFRWFPETRPLQGP
ncbi:YbfB/YjiJ family MFS transporter [Wenzhouxiangella sp. XN201]|uniref:MFS transporter n=1 Tax=Wenzhouxiangella sp. XN201 TaxID=2710755 RepID=UPI0013C6892E|nr:MFS transporter [Wenzhouxiangella sp. XN201]NEZ02571.1 YbfB/YjiJ family MFS transporter [Wenzhouxiangella sp. XN201]